jgi:hypothetical protein
MPRCHRVAREHALPFDPLVPNEATIAAMKEARSGKLEIVTLSDLQAVLEVECHPDAVTCAATPNAVAPSKTAIQALSCRQVVPPPCRP